MEGSATSLLGKGQGEDATPRPPRGPAGLGSSWRRNSCALSTQSALAWMEAGCRQHPEALVGCLVFGAGAGRKRSTGPEWAFPGGEGRSPGRESERSSRRPPAGTAADQIGVPPPTGPRLSTRLRTRTPPPRRPGPSSAPLTTPNPRKYVLGGRWCKARTFQDDLGIQLQFG